MKQFKASLVTLTICSSALLQFPAHAQTTRNTLPDVEALYSDGYAATSRVNGGYPYNSTTLPAPAVVPTVTIEPPVIGTVAAKTTAKKAAPAPQEFAQPIQLEGALEYPRAENVIHAPATASTTTQPPVISYDAPAYTPPAATPPAIEKISPKPELAAAEPNYVTLPSATAAASPLSEETLAVLKHVPRYVASTGKITTQRISVERARVDESLTLNASEAETSESMGMSISVRKPAFSSNYELQRAYDAVAQGDTAIAASIYEMILQNNPRNQDALFGYATLNQRLENNHKARSTFAKLLKVNPRHTEGLNNFLALVVEESPAEALPYLQALIKNNPKFAPAYAQIAKVYQHLSDHNNARNAMSNALALDPDNLVYRYNYAILLDQQEQYKAAAELYLSLIRASLSGQAIPTDAEAIQQRLNYIQSQLITS